MGSREKVTLDFCPCCGRWDRPIVESEGWCIVCIDMHHPTLRKCIKCDSVFARSTGRDTCSKCTKEKWLSVHADQIENYLLKGLKYADAINRVKADIRPNCVVCSKSIRGSNGGLFCPNAKCQRIAKQYHTMRRRSTKEQALKELGLL